MDQGRKLIAGRVKDRGLSLRRISTQMGRNVAYLHQFLNKNSPTYLDEPDREQLSKILGLTAAEQDLLRPPSKGALTVASQPDREDMPSDNPGGQMDPRQEIMNLLWELPYESLHVVREFIEFERDKARKAIKDRPYRAG